MGLMPLFHQLNTQNGTVIHQALLILHFLTIRVGAPSETEMKKKKEAIEDGLLQVCRARRRDCQQQGANFHTLYRTGGNQSHTGYRTRVRGAQGGTGFNQKQ
jgi:hypothetical protein